MVLSRPFLKKEIMKRIKKDRIFKVTWNDHESLFRARKSSDAREQAQLLYGRDALSRRTRCCLVSDDDLVRLIRDGNSILSFSLPVLRSAVRTVEKIKSA